MNNELKNTGFSLTEVLLAVVILAVGMIFIAGVFPVGIHFATIATERTIAAVVADEAFAKIRLYGIDPNELSGGELKNFNDVLPPTVNIGLDEFAYPSTDSDISQKRYFWSALCRDIGGGNVQLTVFVSRKTGAGLNYYDTQSDGTVDWLSQVGLPKPVKIEVREGGEPDELEIVNTTYPNDDKPFINDGYTIIDDKTGRLYRVLERYPDNDDTILLGRDWDDDNSSLPGNVWVIPPPLAPGTGVADRRCSGRYPCIAIYQKVIRF